MTARERFPNHGGTTALAAAVLGWLSVPSPAAADLSPAAARGVYDEHCASCHGARGRPPPGQRGVPDLSRCEEARGPTADWQALVRHGGPFLGMSAGMPAFGATLSDEEIAAVVSYVQSLCPDPRYPPADLNYPDPIFLSNAFPEDEVIVTSTHESGRRRTQFSTETFVQKRVGARDQLGVVVPVGVTDPRGSPITDGVDDVRLSYRRVLVVAPPWNSIAAGALELTLPTGNRRNGVGSGTPAGAAGILSGHAVGPVIVQSDLRAELPVDPARAPRRMRYRLALQYPLGPYQKDPVPGLEFEQTQAIASAVHTETLLAPTLLWPLSRRGHVVVGVGSQLPVAGKRTFDWRVGAELYWEYAEGPIWAW